MCQIWYKFHFCSQGASCVADNGWVNRAGETYVRPYAREIMLRRECSGLRYRGCSGQEYVGGDTNESDNMCPQCESASRSHGRRRRR
ncbi:hypothetical protein NEUTE1DRAFT_41847 [Neurospora tetrasperma FGSC 2508]|uniref:Uncharacterized protein n=2 Tax=Neurospora TaxID=5140 RepID=A0AAJ0IBC4_9PEZI|nr:uncharacterized protein NEUTE1DRAFT_41847 [Neurospora tetrasperma FGSC 2508]EGO58505.1 hypothetical protein NEUTE1DRAFT_41847 [Neurospora tetrasperma FGSC 2508]EGZ71155.1 hypothetical protein NEUTE2DRAFT_64212 [Neurospora tetrasperma FGSC 2509]KAK3495429.1 hypothetical protein B0T23DRAFT_441303 [Neurospora hispaniola]